MLEKLMPDLAAMLAKINAESDIVNLALRRPATPVVRQYFESAVH